MGEDRLKKILVIENQAQDCNQVLASLKEKGFCAIGAENGHQGVQLARENLPDVITCGVLVEEFDGYNVLQTLRQDPRTAIIPFIFVTGKDARTDIRKAMELGANDYLIKPCPMEELLRAIAAQLDRHTALQKLYASRESVAFPIPASPIAKLQPDDHQTSSDPLLDRVFNFIDANYHLPITLTDVARAVGYSPAYLTSLIGRQTGQTVNRWIIDRRMTAARSLLLETDEVIEQIATQVGYHHAVHFSASFASCMAQPRKFGEVCTVNPNSQKR